MDNLIIVIEGVSPVDIEGLAKILEVGQRFNVVPNYRREIGKGVSSFHHIFYIGQGGGAIHIGWKHNTKRENLGVYDMRIEFNPSKQDDSFRFFWEEFGKYFRSHRKLVREFDLAFDIPENINNIAAVSLTGRDRSLFKNTVYYGSSGLHGRLKIYDKKKELKAVQKIEIEEEYLTRIEYTVKLTDPLHYNFLSRVDSFGINKDYTISNFNLGSSEGSVKASVLAVQNGMMELKEFTRTYKKKIKEALENMEKIDLDHAYRSAREDILKVIYSYVN